MTYDLSPSLFLENGPAVQAAAARSANRSAHDFARRGGPTTATTGWR